MYINTFPNGERVNNIKTTSVVIFKFTSFIKCFITLTAGGLVVFWKQNLTLAPFLPLTGDYGSAIETLVTAISLIKQSKVSADDRCKVLISSLQDCLHGIESKSYGSGSR